MAATTRRCTAFEHVAALDVSAAQISDAVNVALLLLLLVGNWWRRWWTLAGLLLAQLDEQIARLDAERVVLAQVLAVGREQVDRYVARQRTLQTKQLVQIYKYIK